MDERKIITDFAAQQKNSPYIQRTAEKTGWKTDFSGPAFKNLNALVSTGEVVCYQGKYRLTEYTPFEKAVISRVNGTFGFATLLEKEGEVFLPGKYLLGAMPGDTVLVKLEPTQRSSDAGRVVSIISQNDTSFTGVFHRDGDICTVEPDRSIRFPVRVGKKHTMDAREGDKVMARIVKRGEHHSDHRAEIVEVFGNSNLAKVCCKSILAANQVEEEFPSEVLAQAQLIESAGIPQSEYAGREDLRGLPIFTIDGSGSKDLDDASSISRTKTGYLLGVHIADVSHYVTAKSPLDNEAFERGTSVYYAQSVVPMLPVALSNGICSLNPQEDRLTFSCFVELDTEGRMQGYRFCKSVICSRVKGVYSEVNRILDGQADEVLKEKYDGLFEEIALMEELAAKLETSRFARGSLNLESVESKIIVDEEGRRPTFYPATGAAPKKLLRSLCSAPMRRRQHMRWNKGFRLYTASMKNPAWIKQRHLRKRSRPLDFPFIACVPASAVIRNLPPFLPRQRKPPMPGLLTINFCAPWQRPSTVMSILDILDWCWITTRTLPPLSGDIQT